MIDYYAIAFLLGMAAGLFVALVLVEAERRGKL